jgi:hypothetical protein
MCREEIPTAQASRSQEDGLLQARCGAQAAGLPSGQRVQPNGSSVKAFPDRERQKTPGFINAQAARSR